MNFQYASDLSTPGCLYKPNDGIAVPRKFQPEAYFFVMAFGPVIGEGNLWGIPSDLLSFLESEGSDIAPYWTNTAEGNELNAQKKTVGYMTMTRMVCEFRLSQVEQCYIFWDYSPTTVLDRKRGL